MQLKLEKLSYKYIIALVVLVIALTAVINSCSRSSNYNDIQTNEARTKKYEQLELEWSDTAAEALAAVTAKLNHISDDIESQKKQLQLIKQQQQQQTITIRDNLKQQLNQGLQTTNDNLTQVYQELNTKINNINAMKQDFALAALPEPIIETWIEDEAILAAGGRLSASQSNNAVAAYTIPTNSTLFDATTMTALIGRVPVEGNVVDPYPFKVIIGADNLTANGMRLPALKGMVASGSVIGDMQLSCVRAEVTSLSFIFADGTVAAINSNGSQQLTNTTNKIGYLSTNNGNPCIPGTLFSNAPKVLAGELGISAVAAAGEAVASMQQINKDSNNANHLSWAQQIGNLVMGKSVSASANKAGEWWLQHQQDSFDAIYVPAGNKVIINITQQLDIDYNDSARKIEHE